MLALFAILLIVGHGHPPSLPRDYSSVCGRWVQILAPHEIESLLREYDEGLARYFPKYKSDPAGLRRFANRYKNFVLNREQIRGASESESIRRATAEQMQRAGKGARVLGDYAVAAIFYTLAGFFLEAIGPTAEPEAKAAFELAAFSFSRAGEMYNDDEMLAISAIIYEWTGWLSKVHEIRVHLIYPERIEQLKRGMYDPPRYSSGPRDDSSRSAPKPKQDIRSDSDLLVVLGLPPGATAEEIKRARNKLAMELHSDRREKISEAESKKMDARLSAITEAFKELRARGRVD